MKKLLWTGLAAVVSAVSAAAAMRVLDAVWRRVAKEAPPEMPGWAKLLVGRPLKGQVQGRIHPGTL